MRFLKGAFHSDVMNLKYLPNDLKGKRTHMTIPARLMMSAVLVTAPPLFAQTSNDPFPVPIPSTEGVIRVDFVEFSSIPDIDGTPARMMRLVDEPGTGRIFVNDMRGPIYTVSYDGRTVTEYVDIDDPRWEVTVQSRSRETGFQSFAFHPQFSQPGTGGYGKFYTWTDSRNTDPAPDFTPSGGDDAHDTILLEWTARNPPGTSYDGRPPRELLRIEQPFGNHNGGQIGFSPLLSPGDADFGLLYVSVADGGSGGDPLNLAQNLASIFGKILRIDPLGSNSANGEYGIPAGNPFAGDGDAATLGEIYAYGVRNAQRFAWDPMNGNMFLADIGQNIVEKLTLVTAGANLGWNVWEGSFRFISRSEVDLANQRGDPSVTYPVVEWGAIGSLATAPIRGFRAPHISRRCDSSAREPRSVRGPAERRDLLCPGRRSSERRTECHPPDLAERRRRGEDATSAHSRKKHRPRQITRYTRGSAFRPRTR